jgi:hypothetical protein
LNRAGRAYALRSVCRTNALSVVKETQSIQRFPLSLGIGVHQFVEWRCSLDFEEDFIVVLESPSVSRSSFASDEMCNIRDQRPTRISGCPLKCERLKGIAREGIYFDIDVFRIVVLLVFRRGLVLLWLLRIHSMWLLYVSDYASEADKGLLDEARGVR